MFVLNIFLMLVWVAVSGQYTLASLVFGFLLGYASLWIVYRRSAARSYFHRFAKALELIGFFLYELVKANVRLTHEILTPPHSMRPAILAVPLDVKSESGILLLGALITLTPGSLSMDLSEDRRVLFVHSMFVDDAEQAVRDIKIGFERRVIEVMGR